MSDMVRPTVQVFGRVLDDDECPPAPRGSIWLEVNSLVAWLETYSTMPEEALDVLRLTWPDQSMTPDDSSEISVLHLVRDDVEQGYGDLRPPWDTIGQFSETSRRFLDRVAAQHAAWFGRPKFGS